MNKPVPLWALLIASTLALFFLCGGVSVAAVKPEPETITKTETKTVKVKDTKETKRLQTKIDKLETQIESCQKTNTWSIGHLYDMMASISTIESGTQELIDEMAKIGDEANTYSKYAKECDPNLSDKLDF